MGSLGEHGRVLEGKFGYMEALDTELYQVLQELLGAFEESHSS